MPASRCAMFELTAGRDPGRLAHGEGLAPRCQGWAGAASASGRVGIRPDVVTSEPEAVSALGVLPSWTSVMWPKSRRGRRPSWASRCTTGSRRQGRGWRTCGLPARMA